MSVTLAEIMADSGHYSIASTTARAQVSAAGEKGTRSWLLAGRAHCRADALGRPLAFYLTVGEAADCRAYDALIAMPEQAPKALLADRGYDANADAIRADLDRRDIQAIIPGRSNRKAMIERFFGHMKINRAIATR